MRLHYVWIKEFANIKEEGFNLTSDYEYKFDYESRKLTVKKSKKFSSNLFGSQISDLKVIVGENGTGKSNLLEFITNWIGNYHLPAIVVFDTIALVSEDLRDGFSLTGLDVEPLFYGLKTQIPNEEKPYRTTGLVFYSSFYDNRRERHSSYAKDVSTNHLIKIDKNSFKGNQKNLSDTHAHKISDLRRQIAFIDSKIIENLPFEYPEFVGSYFKSKFHDENEQTVWRQISGNTFYGRVVQYIQNTAFQRYQNNFGFLEAQDYGLFVLILKSAILEKYIFKSLIGSAGKDTSIAANYLESSGEFLNRLDMPKEIRNVESIDIVGFFDLMLREFLLYEPENQFLISIQNFFNFINNELKESDVTMRISISSANERPQQFASHFVEFNIKRGVFLKFVELYERTIDFEEYLDFTPENLSSGQYSFINLFSRLFSVVEDEKIKDKSDLIILLDEAEAGFHPQWQKELFNHLINFIPKIFTGKNVQVIIATNSPFMLSDVPKRNVIFLEKKHKAKLKNGRNTFVTGVIENDKTKNKKTFGANIYELLEDAFFLHDGYIGNFADSKIMEVLAGLNKKGKADINRKNYYKEIIEIIDEPLIKNKLKKLFVSKYKSWND